MSIKIIESYDSFRMFRESGAYYIDKTIMLKEYLEDNFKPRVLFARPRRFGKTLTMTMFRDFLDVNQDSRDIFAGLRIMDYPDTVSQILKNKYESRLVYQGYSTILKYSMAFCGKKSTMAIVNA